MNLSGAMQSGGVPKRPTGSDCKSDGASLRRFESFPHHHGARGHAYRAVAARGSSAGVAQLVERKPSKLDVAGSSPVSRSVPARLILARVAQLVEHTLGKGEVIGSIPIASLQVVRVGRTC